MTLCKAAIPEVQHTSAIYETGFTAVVL